MSGDAGRWMTVKEVFQAALDQPAAQRLRYVRDRCGDDSVLFREVESLLAAHEQAGPYADRPAIDAFITSSEIRGMSSSGAHRALQPGLHRGPYRVDERIGHGGMGEVYRARDTRLDRLVAIKVLPAHVADDADLKQRFEREARTLATISAPHICSVFDVGQQDGIDYLVMEHLEGETLAARLTRGSLPLEQALRCAIEIAGALDSAHRRGIVHRDLKPGNVMLTKRGAVLLDVGLAKRQLVGLGAPADPTARLTEVGMVVGTLHYMAPEQVQSKEADARSDIFAFGSVLYEMVSGQRAFDGGSSAEVIAAILDREPSSLVALQPALPRALDRVVKTCLAKDQHRARVGPGDVIGDHRRTQLDGDAREVAAHGCA